MSQDETVELEMDELNQHECMANMTALLRHMQRNNITPKVEEVSFSMTSAWPNFELKHCLIFIFCFRV